MDINDVSVGQQIELRCSSLKAETMLAIKHHRCRSEESFHSVYAQEFFRGCHKVSFNFTVSTFNHFFFSFCLGLATFLPEQFPPEPLQNQKIQSHNGRRIGPMRSARVFNGVFHFRKSEFTEERNDVT